MSRLTDFLKTMIGMDSAEPPPKAAPVERPFERDAPDEQVHSDDSAAPAAATATPADDAPVQPLEAVEVALRVFGVKRPRDLDSLIRPSRGAAAFFWTIGSIVLLALVAAGSGVLTDAATRLELGDHPHRVPVFIAVVLAAVAATAAAQLVVRMRRAERRRLFRRVCAEWVLSPLAQTIDQHFTDRFQISLKRIASGNRIPHN